MDEIERESERVPGRERGREREREREREVEKERERERESTRIGGCLCATILPLFLWGGGGGVKILLRFG